MDDRLEGGITRRRACRVLGALGAAYYGVKSNASEAEACAL